MLQSVWENVGNVPLLSLKNFAGEKFEGNLYANLESHNPTGLFTDRLTNKVFNVLNEQKKFQ